MRYGKDVLLVASLTVFFTAFALAGLEVVSAASDQSAAKHQKQWVGRASVIDGNTLEIHNQRIRLHGIDAPESGQTCRDGNGANYRCGQRAALALSDEIGQQTVTCEMRNVDQYTRVVAVCRAGGQDLNAWIVRQGWAVDYRQYSNGKYAAAETDARQAQRGVWSGQFEKPWDWRRNQRTASSTTAPRSAPPPP